MSMNRFFLAAAITVILLFSSCVTTVFVDEEMSPAEMIQRAHEAMDRNNYAVAIQYYEALGLRFSHDIDLVITSKYHIAFINYKQKYYTQARVGMLDVISYYNAPDAVFYPQHFKRLAQIVLENIERQS